LPTKNTGSPEDCLGNRILRLPARGIEAKFMTAKDNWSDAELANFDGLVSEIDSCWAGLPSHVRGVRVKDSLLEDEGLSGVWFYAP
jgi:hypothetical protein